MKKKYKTATKEEVAHTTLSVPENYRDKVITREVFEILYKFENAKSIEEQVVLIPQFTEHIKPPASHDIDAIITILTHLLINANPKHPVKKSITRIFTNLQNLTELSKNISLQIAKQLLQEIVSIEIILDTFLYKLDDFDQVNNIINVINGCYENFPTGLNAISYNISEIFSFLIRSFYSFSDALESVTSPILITKIHNYIHNSTRAIIATSQQFIVSRTLYKTYKSGLYQRCLTIINNQNIPYDTKSNCGIIMVTVANYTKENGYEDLLKICLEPEIPWYTQDEDLSEITTDIGVICVFSGILNTVKPKELVQYNSTSLYLITSRLTEILAKSVNIPSIILGVNRTMLLVSRSIFQLEIQHLLKLLNILLNYVWMNLDHTIDTVRHIARSIYVNLIKICITHRDNGNSSVLDNLIKKTLSLPLQRSCRYRAITAFANEIGSELILKNEENLVNQLLKLSENDTMATYVVPCYEALMRSHMKEIPEAKWKEIWVQPLLDELGKDPESETNSAFQNLLTIAIRLNPTLLQSILPERSRENHVEFCSLLKCALIARQIGTSCDNEGSDWRGLLQPVILEEAMYHQNDEIRVSSLALVCDSHKSTEIFNNWELTFIINFLNYNLGSQLPSIRQQILSLMKRITTRFNESYKLILRNITKSMMCKHKKLETFNQQRDCYEEFMGKLRKCLIDNLFQGANYTRRTLCLEIFKMMRPIYETMPEEWQSNEVEALLMCLHDSYEHNKGLAVSLLRQCPVSLLRLNDLERTRNFIDEGIKYACSVKPSETITAAYILETASLSPVLSSIFEDVLSIPSKKHNDYCTEYLIIRYLLTQQRCQLEIAKQNLVSAARSAPLHGVLFCMRHLMEKYILSIQEPYWKPLIGEMIKVCLELDNTVAPIVKNSSPEGHLPMDQEPVENDYFQSSDETVTAQMLLVCAWRTVKEVSLLLSEICLKGKLTSESESGIITEDQILVIGEHFTQLLTETRHRGAFEHAYIGFSRLCNRLWKCTSPKLHYLPIQWLEDIMDVISGNTNKDNRLCETRRSAGLPFMIQAIVASELHSGGNANFKNCMLMLLDFAQNSKKLETRTHAMNILRALFRHTQLGEIVLPYVAEGFMAAIIGFTKPTWTERNSATLLFSSLMTRTFGVQRTREGEKMSQKNKLSTKMFNQKYPSLQPFLLKQLMTATSLFEKNENEDVLYPVLILLARLHGNCLDEDPYCNLDEFIPYIKKCAQGRILRTRELASKALSSILNESSKMKVMKELFLELETVKNNNYLHGVLLQISQLLYDTSEIERDLDILNIIEATQWIIKINCPIVAALYMETLVQLTIKSVEKKLNNVCQILINDIDSILEKDIAVGSSVCLRGAYYLKLHLVANVMNSPLDLKCLRTKEIIFKSFSFKDKEIHNFSLNFLIYLLNEDKNSVIINSWDIPPEEKYLVELFTYDMQKHVYNLINEEIDLFASKLEQHLSNNDILASKSFAVLSHFPKVLHKIPLFYNEFLSIVDKNKDICDNNMSCAALCCLKSLIKQNLIKDYEKFSKLIYEFSFSSYSVSCRYIVALILCENHHLLKSPEIDGISLCTIWQTIMQLLGDNELVVRNTMSNLAQIISKNTLPVVPERAREILLQYCIETLNNISEELCTSLLLFWIFDDDDQSDDESFEGQIFEKGEVNSYVEKVILSKLAAKKLPLFFSGKEISFFITFSNILLNSSIKFWNVLEDQKRVFAYYCKKIDSELKRSNDFASVRSVMTDDEDFWIDGEEFMKWRFLDILDSFIEFTT